MNNLQYSKPRIKRARRSRAVVLISPLDLGLDFMGCTQYKLGFTQKLPGDKCVISRGIWTVLDNFAGKGCIVDRTDSANLEVEAISLDCVANVLGKLSLESWSKLDLLLDVDTATANVENVDSQRRQLLGEASSAL